MARLELSLPEDLGSRGDVGRAATTHARHDVGVGRRTDGSGEELPVIVRWFRTWATGDTLTA
jgi:hypothetical protein